MLKTAISPILSFFPVKPRSSNVFFSQAVATSFSKTSRAVRLNASTNLTALHQSPSTSAYIHLPFCRKRCHYCDFPIVALGSSSGFSSSQEEHDPRILNYIQLLVREVNATRTDFEANPSLETVFFGGGTPSLVPPSLISRVLDMLKAKFGVSRAAEISMEMDPGTFDTKKLKELMDLGVNRVSLGVQAFQDELLKACGRVHGVREVFEAIDIVGSSGIENWSMDLISSLPHQTLEMWEESLRFTIQACPKHVSVYDLQVEQGTKFGNLYTPGEFPLPSESQSADFYRTASRMLTNAGYDHYEISSYSKDGFQCKHNLTYWKSKPFYGFGLGSASYIGGLRFSRPRKLKEYETYVQNLENGVVRWCGDGHVDDPNDLAMDIVMLSLRTARGLELKPFGEAFGFKLVHSLCEAYKPYVESGHVVCLSENRRAMTSEEFKSMLKNRVTAGNRLGSLRLSDPDGFLLSNELISFAFRAVAK